MVIVDRYRKATAELIIELLCEADRLNLDLDKMLEEISEDLLEEVLEELRKLEKNGKIDLTKGIDLRNNPAIYQTLKEVETKIWHRFTEYCWIGAQVIGEHLIDVQKTTTNRTYEIFGRPDLQIQERQTNASAEPIGTRPLSIPTRIPLAQTPLKVQITDTYNYKDKIEIPWCKDGKIYSQRLYSNVANFESKLAFVLEEGITKGKGMDWMMKAWRKLTGSSASDTARLIKTETMAFWGMSTKEAYLNMGIVYVEIVNDVACNEICVEFVDGDPIPLADAEVGGDLPPYHPYCACSFIAYTEDGEETDDINVGITD